MQRTCRVDPHVKVLDDGVVRRAKARGLDAVVYAPHFTRLPEIAARADRFSDEALTVIPGREVFTGSWRDRKHVLAVGLTEPVPDFISLEAAMAELTRQDAAVLAPHPGFMTVSLGPADLRRYADEIHAVETYNPKHLPRHNRAAPGLAAAIDRPPFASSYAHLRGTVGEVWTTFEAIEPGPAAVVEAFRSGASRRVGHRTGARHRLRCAAEVAHLLYENTVEKLDRVVLPGRADTHPRDPRYGGRFDDVAVY